MELDPILGVADFALIARRNFSVAAFDYFKDYANDVIRKLNSENNLFNCWKNSFAFDFDYLNFFSINAYTEHSNSTDTIRINEGVIFEVFRVFYTLASFFPIAPHLKEPDNPDEETMGIKLVYTFDKNQQYEMVYRIPLDAKRKIIAEYMSMFAIKYIILHEIAHLYNGHIFYHLSKRRLGPLVMINNTNDTKINALDYQAMEMDADAFAISVLIEETLIMLEHDKILCRTLQDRQDVYNLLAYSIHCLFLLIRQEQRDDSDFSNSLYLPLQVRDYTNIDCAKVNVKAKAYNIITEDTFEHIAMTSYSKAEQHFSAAFSRNSSKPKPINPQVLDHFSRVMSHWSILREKLKPFTRTRLAD